jgi:hypothetical protein
MDERVYSGFGRGLSHDEHEVSATKNTENHKDSL